MSDFAIRIEKLTKQYKLYDKPTDRLRESLNPFNRIYHKDFYALRDVSFEVKKGETVGIVGRNGSGKSTLLKLITGVLMPSMGKIDVKGRIAALLELGAGFNPEFTGMQNIYLNGTMMGYSQEEMATRVTSILDFADIGEFINQPVKTYSSGMFVRLAFAVAINVDPDILIIDEALAVGDDLFQRKCYSKFEDFKSQGKTILFVSHVGGTIIEFCDRALLLDSGERIIYGNSAKVVNLYHKLLYSPLDKAGETRGKIKEMDNVIENEGAYSNGIASVDNRIIKQVDEYAVSGSNGKEDEIEEYYDPNLIPKDPIVYEQRGAEVFEHEIVNSKGKKVNVLNSSKKYVWKYKVRFSKTCYNVRFGMLIKTTTGSELGGAATAKCGMGIPLVRKGDVINVEFKFSPKLASGTYFINCGVLSVENDEEVYLDRRIDAAAFRVSEKKNSLMTSLIDFDIQSSTL